MYALNQTSGQRVPSVVVPSAKLTAYNTWNVHLFVWLQAIEDGSPEVDRLFRSTLEALGKWQINHLTLKDFQAGLRSDTLDGLFLRVQRSILLQSEFDDKDTVLVKRFIRRQMDAESKAVSEEIERLRVQQDHLTREIAKASAM